MRSLLVMEDDLIRETLPEAEVNSDNLDKVKELLEWAQARDARYKDCGCLAANQIGMRVRALAFFDPREEEWVGCLNPYITETKGDAASVLKSIINCPKSYVRTDVFPECVLEYDDMTGKPEKKILKGDAAVLIQFLCKILDGTMPEILPRDFRTIRREERKLPNEKCPVCQRKNKRCTCERTTDGNTDPGCQQAGPILSEARGGEANPALLRVAEGVRIEERKAAHPENPVV